MVFLNRRNHNFKPYIHLHNFTQFYVEPPKVLTLWGKFVRWLTRTKKHTCSARTSYLLVPVAQRIRIKEYEERMKVIL